MLKRFFFLFPLFLAFVSTTMPSHASEAAPASGVSLELPPLTIEIEPWDIGRGLWREGDVRLSLGRKTPTSFDLGSVLDGRGEAPDLGIVTSGGLGRLTTPTLGGCTGPRVLVLRDGLPQNDPLTGVCDLGACSADGVERVDLRSGSGATIWGSGAVGGTIHLISRFPGDPEDSPAAEGRGDSGRLGQFFDGVGGQGTRFETQIGCGAGIAGLRLSSFDTPGWSAASGRRGNAEPDGFSRDEYEFGVRNESGRRTEWRLQSGWLRARTDLDDISMTSGLPIDSLTFRQERREGRWSFAWNRPDRRGEWNVFAGRQTVSSEGLDESNPFNAYGFQTRIQRQAIERDWDFSHGRIMIGGTRLETHASNRGLFATSQVESGQFIGGTWRLSPALRLQGIARRDEVPGHQPVGNGACDLEFHHGSWVVGAGWGSSFRQSTLNERFYPAFGNPGLRPESGVSANLLLRWEDGKGGMVRVQQRRTRVRDLIATVATTDPAYPWGVKPENLDVTELEQRLCDFEKTWTGGWKLGAGFQKIERARVLSSGMTPPRIPGWASVVKVGREIGAWEFQALCRWWGASWDDLPNRAPVASSRELALGVARHWRQATVRLDLENLTNALEERVRGYTRPGRRVALAGEIRF